MSEPVITRRPFMIGEHTVMLVTLFEKPTDRFDDIWLLDMPVPDAGADAAKQFISQLEDRWSPHFLMELRKAITEKLAAEDAARGVGTRFAEYICP